MTFIVPRGGFDAAFPETLNQSGLLGYWNGARDVLASLLGPIVPNDPTSSYNLQ